MKKVFILISIILVTIIAFVSFSASADDGTIVIDNVVYELTSEKYGKYDYGEHYAVIDFFEDEALAETTTKINIVDEIDGIEVVAINTNYDAGLDHDTHFPENKYSNPSVKIISIPGTIKYICAYAFYNFTGVEKLYLPAELERIGTGAFCLMKSLETITIPPKVTYISAETFSKCENLKKVEITGDILGIGEFAFYDCKNLTSLNFPYSIREYGEYAFDNTALKKVIIPENINILGDGGGIGCSSFEKIVFEDTSADKANYITFSMLDGKLPLVKGIYIKAIPTDGILVWEKDIEEMTNLEKIYFAGSEQKWNKLTYDSFRAELENRGIEVVFYYRHTHSFTRNGDPTCTKGGKFTYSCECGDTQTVTLQKDPDNHSYGSWKVTKKATYADYGTKQRTCKNCGKVQKAKVKKLVFGELENLTATVKDNDVVLSWGVLEGATGYRVYIFDKDKGDNIKLASFKDKTTYTVSDLEAGETYVFRVKPYNKTSDGKVTWSKSFPITVTVQ